MSFEVTTLSKVNINLHDLQGLSISEKRLPDLSSGACAFDSVRGLVFLPLRITTDEGRDGFEGYYLLLFGRDPIVIDGWRQARILESNITRKYNNALITSTIREAASVRLPNIAGAFSLMTLPDRASQELRAKERFQELLSKNKLRARRELKEKLIKPFSFMLPKKTALQKVGGFMLDVMDGNIGPQCTADLQINVRVASDSTYIATFTNRIRSTIRELTVTQDQIVDLMCPGIKSFAGRRSIGFDYHEIPDANHFEDLKILRIAGKSEVSVHWPKIAYFEPMSSYLALSYAKGWETTRRGYLTFASVDRSEG